MILNRGTFCSEASQLFQDENSNFEMTSKYGDGSFVFPLCHLFIMWHRTENICHTTNGTQLMALAEELCAKDGGAKTIQTKPKRKKK